MQTQNDPFELFVVKDEADAFSALGRKPILPSQSGPIAASAIVTARFHGFNLSDQPRICDVPSLPGEIVAARSTVPLLSEHIGSTVVVFFEQGDMHRPIIIGIVQGLRSFAESSSGSRSLVSVELDDNRLVLVAEREIVMRCGDASITLTRAGKVLIQGAYVSSRSSGVNRIKGGSVEIN